MTLTNLANSISSLATPEAQDTCRDTTIVDGDRSRSIQDVVCTSPPDQEPGQRSTRADVDSEVVSSDLWSLAYREAIDSFGEEIDVAILMSSNVAHLFNGLEEIDKDATKDSAFLRGVAYLHSIKVPLEKFKLAIDLASPLSRLDPTAMTVVGVVSSVTAVSLLVKHCECGHKSITRLTSLNTDCHKLCNCRLTVREANWRNARTHFLHR